MKQTTTISDGEMRELLGHIWARSFFASKGNAGRGKSVFASKKCGTCHVDGGAPKLEGSQSSVISMVAALWKHGPAMREELKRKNMEWPQLTPNQMSDLVAYVAQPAR